MDRKDFFKEKFIEWRNELNEHWKLITVSLIIVIIAAVIDYYAGIYVTYQADVANVSDLILDHFGPYDLSLFYVWGYLLILGIYFIYPLFFKVRNLHIVIAQFSFLTILRSLFIILTHLQTPLDAIPTSFPGIFHYLRFENDLFFSGHVAFAFLGFLIFKDIKIKYFFLIGSIIMAITVLGMHQHYSIDVFAAFFIAYGSYKICNYLLKKIHWG